MNCPKCGRSRIESATVDGAALRPDAAPITKKIFSVGMQLLCSVCRDCGAIFDLRVDTARLADQLD